MTGAALIRSHLRAGKNGARRNFLPANGLGIAPGRTLANSPEIQGFSVLQRRGEVVSRFESSDRSGPRKSPEVNKNIRINRP